MSANTCDAELPRQPSRALPRAAFAPFQMLRGALRGVVERRLLDALSHHSLQDIGLTRFEIDHEIGKTYRRD